MNASAKTKIASACVILAAALAIWPVKGRSEFVAQLSVEVRAHADGSEYVYVLTNPVENGEDGDDDLIDALEIVVSENADLMHIESPTGFEVTYQAGDASIIWVADDFEPSLAPGESATFRFVSRLGPGEANYTARAINQLSTGGNLDEFSGTTSGPTVAAVPEPTALLSLGSGILLLAGYAIRPRSSSGS